MDLIAFDQSVTTQQYSDLLLRNANVVNGWDKLSWVEKYKDPSEFSVSGYLESNLREQLPIGTIVTQINSGEVMIVENHEISTSKDKPPEITISGRSLESIFQYRVIGSRILNVDPEANGGVPDNHYWGITNWPWDQVYYILASHSIGPPVVPVATTAWNVRAPNQNDTIQNLRISIKTRAIPDVQIEEREVQFTDVLSVVQGILPSFDGGLRSIRSNWGYGINNPDDTSHTQPKSTVLIHNGVDRSSSVAFSHSRGEVESANYLFSSKNDVNGVVIMAGQGPKEGANRLYRPYRAQLYYTSIWGMRRKMGIVSDRDVEVTSRADSAANAKLAVVGRDYLARKNPVEISNIRIAPNSTEFQYRRDYDIGDLVGVEGEFESATVRRVTEFAEFEDENGYTAIPTLSKPTLEYQE